MCFRLDPKRPLLAFARPDSTGKSAASPHDAYEGARAEVGIWIVQVSRVSSRRIGSCAKRYSYRDELPTKASALRICIAVTTFPTSKKG